MGGRSEYVAGLSERLARQFDALGIGSNVKANVHSKQIRALISSDDAQRFEQGVVSLGTLLGFEAGKIEEEGSPDPWWQVDDELCFIFEAHSGATADKIGSGKSRQAALQGKFIREKLRLSENASVTSILISEGKPGSEAASIYLDGTCLWSMSEFKKWAYECLDMQSDLKKSYSNSPDLTWRAKAADMYMAVRIDPISFKSVVSRWPGRTRRAHTVGASRGFVNPV
ncbi:MAG: hypothetical protein WA431_02760 [Candidatus Cybelea sp.]